MKRIIYILISFTAVLSCMKERGASSLPGGEIAFTVQDAPFAVSTKSSGVSDELILCEEDGIVLKATYSPMDNIIDTDTKVSETTASTLASSGFYVSAVTGSAGSEVSAWGQTTFSGGPSFTGGKVWPLSNPGYKFYASNASSLYFNASGTYVSFDGNKDIVVAYNNSPTYNSSNALSFSHIYGQIGTVTVEEDTAGAGFYIQNVTIEAPENGNYNIRTGTWSGCDSFTEYDVVSNRYAGTSACDYVFVPGTWDAYADITVGGENKQLRFQITIVKGQRTNLTLSIAAPYSSSSQELLPGLFSVSSSQKVAFTRGNVQAVVDRKLTLSCWTSSHFRLAEHQWDYAYRTEMSPKIGELFDMFAWIGESATDSNWKVSYGMVDSDDYYEAALYGEQNDELMLDWGDGMGLRGSGYRTMSEDEWRYLLFSRTNAAQKRSPGRIQVGGGYINGYILLPDNWSKPSNCTFTASANSYTTNAYYSDYNSGDYNCWDDMEQAGAVFLPAAGERRSDWYYLNENAIGFYATTTSYGCDEDRYTIFSFSDDDTIMDEENRYYGVSVRLVKTMQSSVTTYHESVDLGLRDKNGNRVLFATTNVGASSPTDYGDYFAWGETDKRYTSIDGTTITGGTFQWSNTPYHTGSDSKTGWTKYVPSSKTSYWGGSGSPDNILELQRMDDAARVQWGGDWRTPTEDELQWLVDNCTWTGQIDYNGSGVNGYLVTSKHNSASLFLPCAGWCDGSSRYVAGMLGGYCSSSLNTSDPHYAFILYFSCIPEDEDFEWYMSSSSRYCGFSVRPVRTAAP